MHIPTLFPLIVQQKLIIKNQVLPVVPPPIMCNPKWEVGKWEVLLQQFCHFWCQKSERNPIMTRLCGMTITETKTFVRLEKFTWWKTPLNTRVLKTRQNVHLHSIFLAIHLVVCSLHRQVDFLIFSCKREHLLGIQWLSVKLKWGRTDECQKLKHIIKEIELSIQKKIYSICIFQYNIY